jgi:hypothetical protein
MGNAFVIGGWGVSRRKRLVGDAVVEGRDEK